MRQSTRAEMSLRRPLGCPTTATFKAAPDNLWCQPLPALIIHEAA